MKSPFLILVIASSLLISGCSKLDSFKKNVQDSVTSVGKQADQVKANITETKNNVDRKIEKVQNVINAVDDLKKEL